MMKLKVLLPVLIVFLFSACASPSKKSLFEKYRQTKLLMGTIVHLDVCYDSNQEPKLADVYEKVWKRLEEIHWRMSAFDKKSDLWKINDSYQKPVKVGDDTYQLIHKAIEYSHLTKGAFDITVWPLIDLWKQAQKTENVPSNVAIQKVKEFLGVKNIHLKENGYVEILNPLTRIDLGAIAKGYAIDEAARIFRENGLNNFLIDAGGDIYVGGHNCEGGLWRIGIRDPKNREKIINVIELTNKAVTTSGDYEQFYEIKGKRFSHILNPITGYPQAGVVSATVIAPKAADADALSTALCVLSPQKGIDLIEGLKENYAALIIMQQDTGIKRYATKNYSIIQKK